MSIAEERKWRENLSVFLKSSTQTPWSNFNYPYFTDEEIEEKTKVNSKIIYPLLAKIFT